MFQGSCCALVTPMNADMTLDVAALGNLVDWHLAEGTQALVIAGSTGEGSSLSHDEFTQAIQQVVRQVAGKIPVIAGTGTSFTAATIEKTAHAKSLGVDACLIVAPYYVRPTQEGLRQHYEAIARAVNVPILLYNVPSRTACDLLPETVAALSVIKNIIGIKDATGQLERLTAYHAACAPEFLLYSGDDPTAQAFMAQGGHGVISITANVVPHLMQQMCQAQLQGDTQKAIGLDSQMMRLHKMLVAEPNPIPVKWALSFMQKMQNVLRSPLTPLSSLHHEAIVQALKMAGAYAPDTQFS